MKRDVLTRPFPPELVRQRQGQGGKTISYVETHAVIARLNEAADFEWSFEIVKHEILSDEVIVLGKLTLDGVTKMAFGGSTVTRDAGGRDLSLADDLKSAASDATKKCASLFGIGLELYGGATAATSVREPQPRQESRAEDRLTSRQLAAIQAHTRRKGLGGTELTDFLRDRTGKHEVALLSRKEASRLLDELTDANGTHR